MPNRRRVFLMTCGALCVAMLPVLVHLSIATEQSEIAAGLLALVLVLLAAGVLRLGIAPVATGLVVLAVMGMTRPGWIIHASPVLIYLTLAWLFGRTLRAGRTPMISRFAELEQGRPIPETARYTRGLTWVWSVFFVFMASASVLLAMVAPMALWSLFTNLVSYMLVAALFLGEFAWRHYRFPHLRHASPLQLVQLIRRSSAMTRGAAEER